VDARRIEGVEFFDPVLLARHRHLIMPAAVPQVGCMYPAPRIRKVSSGFSWTL